MASKEDLHPRTAAAQYFRMSTEHQQYSTENQSVAILQYALAHSMTIVRTYADHGKSGLVLSGRQGLTQLLEDVRLNDAPFSAVLVYDLSRWGRFQDADESAYYEHVLKKAGIKIHYCAEPFENDGSLPSLLIKTLKRTMAGEYSRELSVKVFAGQCRLIELGYRQGGVAGYGLRRHLVDETRTFKQVLGHGERKSIQTDRVVLAPGPQEELEVVRAIFRRFTGEQLTEESNEATGDVGPLQWAHTNVYAAGGLIATYEQLPNGTQPLDFQLNDWLGTRRVETDYAGNVQQNCSNLPFGDGATNCIGPTEQFFTGKERDQESGLDHFKFRSYSSTIGRWTSPDPSGLFFADPSNPQSLNLYGYVVNSPLGLSDPNGLWFSCQHGSAHESGGSSAVNWLNRLTNSIAGAFCGGGGGDDSGWGTNPPTGRHYVAISSYTHQVMGMGHMGDGLDSNNTNGWATDKNFTLSDRVLVAVGMPFKGHERRDQITYPDASPRYLYHALTDDQYATIQDRIQQRYDPQYGDQHVYELFLNSCGQNVSDDLRAAHVHGAPPRWLFVPNLDYFWLRLQAH